MIIIRLLSRFVYGHVGCHCVEELRFHSDFRGHALLGNRLSLIGNCCSIGGTGRLLDKRSESTLKAGNRLFVGQARIIKLTRVSHSNSWTIDSAGYEGGGGADGPLVVIISEASAISGGRSP